MPTPASLDYAKVVAIAEDARASCAEEMKKKAREEHPGEGWRATAWLSNQKVTDEIATVLMSPLPDLTGNSIAELAFFRAFGKEGTKELLHALLSENRVIDSLTDLLWPKFVELGAPTQSASAGELHSKFVEQGTGFDLEYAGLKNFFGGLEAVVGSPNPSVLAAMRREVHACHHHPPHTAQSCGPFHARYMTVIPPACARCSQHCHEIDSIEPFTTPNYKMTTTSRIEWWFVEDPIAGLKENRIDSWPAEDPSMISGSAKPRVPLSVASFKDSFDTVNSQLTELGMPTIIEEVRHLTRSHQISPDLTLLSAHPHIPAIPSSARASPYLPFNGLA